MLTVRKVCAAVLRSLDGRRELLVFEHPNGSIQLPKGGLDDGEEPEAGVLRELHEETGLTAVRDVVELGEWERLAGWGPTKSGPMERHVWTVFTMAAPAGLPAEWVHTAWGSAVEDGLRLRCHWVPLDERTHELLHPMFSPVVAMVVEAISLT